MLHSWTRGVGFAAGLTALHGALYGLLVSESNALVLGSILLFAMLAAVMVATRKIDWYSIGKPVSERTAEKGGCAPFTPYRPGNE